MCPTRSTSTVTGRPSRSRAGAAAARAGGHVADRLDAPAHGGGAVGQHDVTASPGLTRYSWVTSRSTVTIGVVLVAVSTVPSPPAPPPPLPLPPPPRAAHRRRDRGDPDGTGFEDDLAEEDLAGDREAERASANA